LLIGDDCHKGVWNVQVSSACSVGVPVLEISVEEVITWCTKVIGLSLMPKQLKAIQKFSSGKDIFVSLPIRLEYWKI